MPARQLFIPWFGVVAALPRWSVKQQWRRDDVGQFDRCKPTGQHDGPRRRRRGGVVADYGDDHRQSARGILQADGDRQSFAAELVGWHHIGGESSG